MVHQKLQMQPKESDLSFILPIYLIQLLEHKKPTQIEQAFYNKSFEYYSVINNDFVIVSLSVTTFKK